MLKREYLDERRAAATASLQGTIADSSVRNQPLASHLGMNVPAHPTQFGTAPGKAGSNPWANALAQGGSVQHNPKPTALSVLPATSNGHLKPGSGTTSVSKLTGQEWYNQSALRAVNQVTLSIESEVIKFLSKLNTFRQSAE